MSFFDKIPWRFGGLREIFWLVENALKDAGQG
jgi:hypothetical protein